MFELYSDRCRRVLINAQAEAFRLGARAISNEHVLLGLLREMELNPPRLADPSEAVVRERDCLAGLALLRCMRVRRVLRAVGLPARKVAGAVEAVAAERALLDAQAESIFGDRPPRM